MKNNNYKYKIFKVFFIFFIFNNINSTENNISSNELSKLNLSTKIIEYWKKNNEVLVSNYFFGQKVDFENTTEIINNQVNLIKGLNDKKKEQVEKILKPFQFINLRRNNNNNNDNENNNHNESFTLSGIRNIKPKKFKEKKENDEKDYEYDALSIITEKTEKPEGIKINTNFSNDELDREKDIEFLDGENKNNLDDILNNYPGHEEIYKNYNNDIEGIKELEEDINTVNIIVKKIKKRDEIESIIFQGDSHNDKEFIAVTEKNTLKIAMGDYLDRSIYEKDANKNSTNSREKDVFSNMAQVFLAINYQLLTNKIAIRGDHEALPIIKGYYLKYLFDENSDNSRGYLAYSLKKILPDSFIIKIKEEKNLIIGNHTTGQDYYKKDEEYNKMMDFIENGENKNGINEDELYKINNFIKDKTGIDNNGLYKDIVKYFQNLKIEDPVDSEEMFNILKKNMGAENINFNDVSELEKFFNGKMQSYLSAMLYINENFLKYKRNVFKIKINKDIPIPNDNLIEIYNQNKMPFSLFTRPSNSLSIEEEHIYYNETYGCFQSWNYLKKVIGENFKNFEKILSFSSHNHEHCNSQKYHAIKKNEIVISGNSDKINYCGQYKNQFSAIPINDFNEKKGNVNEKNKSIYQISLPAGTHETLYGEGFGNKFKDLRNIGVFMKYNIEDGNLSWVDRNLDPIHKE